MKKPEIKIDFLQLGNSFKSYVMAKALKAGSTIVYTRGKELVEENPKTGIIRVLKTF
jgi:hypothetical protein